MILSTEIGKRRNPLGLVKHKTKNPHHLLLQRQMLTWFRVPTLQNFNITTELILLTTMEMRVQSLTGRFLLWPKIRLKREAKASTSSTLSMWPIRSCLWFSTNRIACSKRTLKTQTVKRSYMLKGWSIPQIAPTTNHFSACKIEEHLSTSKAPLWRVTEWLAVWHAPPPNKGRKRHLSASSSYLDDLPTNYKTRLVKLDQTKTSRNLLRWKFRSWVATKFCQTTPR